MQYLCLVIVSLAIRRYNKIRFFNEQTVLIDPFNQLDGFIKTYCLFEDMAKIKQKQ